MFWIFDYTLLVQNKMIGIKTGAPEIEVKFLYFSQFVSKDGPERIGYMHISNEPELFHQ